MNIKLNIPESFYQGEEKCGYYVSPEMKKVWATELDLIAEFARVCKKHDLKWWIDSGTLLGAARHKGFIPWDDDVDIVMMRKDYEKLCEVADSEFQYPYHLRSPHNDRERMHEFAKLHNEETTMIDGDFGVDIFRSGKKFNYSQGIWIDIFPLNDIPDDDRKFMRMLKKANVYRYIAQRLYTTAYVYTPALTKWKRPLKAALHFLVKNTNIGALYMKFFAKYMDVINSYNCPDSKRVVNFLPLSWTPDNRLKNYLMPRAYFDETIELPFEMLTLPAPAHYDEILTRYYGEWHKPEIRSPHSKFYDAERSYKYYIEHGLPEGV